MCGEIKVISSDTPSTKIKLQDNTVDTGNSVYTGGIWEMNLLHIEDVIWNLQRI